jgi:Fungal specific transcription factor domain
MLAAARLFQFSQRLDLTPAEIQSEISSRTEELKSRINLCALDGLTTPSLAVSFGRPGLVATATESWDQSGYMEQMRATAEIFRHALLVYLYRVVNGAHVPLDEDTQRSVDECFELLPRIPDALGPGSNLGWALVIIGCEVNTPDLRHYIRCRWRGLNMLELSNTQAGERLTEEVWRRYDQGQSGCRVHWQEVLRDIGGEQILV